MKALIILVEMIFLHIFADYNLQGILANMKQKHWWVKRAPNYVEFKKSKYKKDYLMALGCHAFEWTFVIMLPMLCLTVRSDYQLGYVLLYLLLFAYNAIAHFIIDDNKANKHNLNLIQDQRLHVLQIVLTWIFWWAFIGWGM